MYPFSTQNLSFCRVWPPSIPKEPNASRSSPRSFPPNTTFPLSFSSVGLSMHRLQTTVYYSVNMLTHYIILFVSSTGREADGLLAPFCPSAGSADRSPALRPGDIYDGSSEVQHLSSELWYRSFWSFFFHLFLKSCYTLLAPTLPVELRDTRVSPCDIVCALVRDEHVEHGSCARTFAGGLVFLPALYGIARSPRLPEHTSLWRCSYELLYLCCVGPLAARWDTSPNPNLVHCRFLPVKLSLCIPYPIPLMSGKAGLLNLICQLYSLGSCGTLPLSEISMVNWTPYVHTHNDFVAGTCRETVSPQKRNCVQRCKKIAQGTVYLTSWIMISRICMLDYYWAEISIAGAILQMAGFNLNHPEWSWEWAEFTRRGWQSWARKAIHGMYSVQWSLAVDLNDSYSVDTERIG